ILDEVTGEKVSKTEFKRRIKVRELEKKKVYSVSVYLQIYILIQVSNLRRRKQLRRPNLAQAGRRKRNGLTGLWRKLSYHQMFVTHSASFTCELTVQNLCSNTSSSAHDTSTTSVKPSDQIRT